MANNYDPLRHHRRSIRLKGHDYSSPGSYFVTLCEQGPSQLFGKIVDGCLEYSEYGRIAAECWEWLESQYDHVVLDEWRVMPDHMHGILGLTDIVSDAGVVDGRGGSRTAPTGLWIAPTGSRTAGNANPATRRKTVGRIVGAFKTVSTKRVNAIRGTPGIRLWQRDFWDRVIRDDDELNRIRDYIRTNPYRWQDP